ncbi:glycosyltransferase family 4 protein [Arthrobacter sp. 24S4-2]|nr:glycosyltransferase family 4 protein [Arthrobacter sp. 24S4-2]
MDVEDNRNVFTGLAQEAVSLVASGSWEDAAVQTQLAARFAWLNHPGLFASSDLETVVGHIRESIPKYTWTRQALPNSQLRVVHVGTQLYAAGGHTQTISRWVREDPSSDHRLVLTRQGSTAVPRKIMECFAGSRRIELLDRRPGGLLKRATVLRKIVSSADVVIVHAHPHDVVPAVALGTEDSPPAVYVNHADHVFWLGTSAADVVLNLRWSGRDLSVRRRGIAPDRCLVANRPLELAPRTSMEEGLRSRSRSRWGVNDEFLVVSAAAESKYDPVGDHSLIRLFAAFLKQRPNSKLLVAGPSAHGQWAEACAATSGRIRALGRLSDVPALLSAADVYVDSFPFASLTSMLEAGAHGLPLVTFRGHPPECAVLGADSPGLEAELFTPSGSDEFSAVLASLADSPSLRKARGASTQAAVLAGHSQAAWRETVRAIYERARCGTRRLETGVSAWQNGPLDQMVARVQQQTGFSGLDAAVADVLSLRPAPERIRQWNELRKSQPVGLSHLLPEWILAGAAAVRRTVSSPS